MQRILNLKYHCFPVLCKYTCISGVYTCLLGTVTKWHIMALVRPVLKGLGCVASIRLCPVHFLFVRMFSQIVLHCPYQRTALNL